MGIFFSVGVSFYEVGVLNGVRVITSFLGLRTGYWAFCTYRVYSLLLGVYAVRWAILHCVGTVFPHSGRVYRVSGVLCMCRVRFT
jgi:hypothetical protein